LQGKFISFEGIDGSGKSTQLRMLAGDLRLRGLNVLTTREPGGTPLGQQLRAAFLETEENVSPLAELLLFAADRAQHVELLIKPALKDGRIVISDRFADATYAYQGAGRGFAEETVNEVIKLATTGLKPDLTLFFDLSVENAILRTASRIESGEQKNRMDVETAEFYGRVRAAYLEISRAEPDRFRVVDANGAVEDIHTQVTRIVNEFLEG
jgi:dTMP kinase